MPFDKGSIPLTICHMPTNLPADKWARFDARKGTSLLALKEDLEVGWVSGRHLLEIEINDDTAITGGFTHLHLRLANRKIPPSLFRAECQLSELKLLRESKMTYLNRRQKKEVRETVAERLIEQMPPTLVGIPFVINARSDLLFIGSTSVPQVDRFIDFFYETFEISLEPLTPEEVAFHYFQIDTDTLRPMNFSPTGREPDSELTIGRDFLTWIWYFQEIEGGIFPTPELGTFSILIDGPLTFIGDGEKAQEMVIRKGLPTISPEAQTALIQGKKLRQARLTLAREKDEIWLFTLDTDRFFYRGLTLPQVEELDSGSRFQERIKFLEIFNEAFLALYKKYLDILINKPLFLATQNKIQNWVTEMRLTGI